MSPRRKLALIVAAGLIILVGAFLLALPGIVRRVALDQVPKRMGRAVAIEDVDLNLFTGHLALKNFRLAEREGPEAFVEFERLDVRLSLPALLRSHLRVAVALAGPAVRIVRGGPAEFNFSDLVPVGKEPAEESKPAAPSRWTVTLERLDVSRGRVRVDDRAVSPPAEWLIQDLGVQATGITTRAGAPPGRLTVDAKIDEAVLAVRADPLRIEPQRLQAELSFDGFEMRRLNPYVYVPLGTPYLPKGGRLAIALAADVDGDANEVKKAVLSGTVNLQGEALAQVGRPDPFLSVARLGVGIKEVDALERTLTVASVDIEGLDLKARRDARGVIDLLEMFTPKASAPTVGRSGVPAGSPAARPASPSRRTLFPIIQTLARGFEQIRVERITLAPSTVAFIDESVKPTTTLALTKFQVGVDDFTWPVAGPARVAVSTGLPGGGTLDVKGPVMLQPFDARLTTTLRNAPVQPYQAYIPVLARLSGRFNGDSQDHIAFRDGIVVLASRGNSWARNVAIRAPGGDRPVISVERMELVGLDVDWPKRAGFVRAGFLRPRLEIEREADGAMNVRQVFTPLEEERSAPAPKPAAAPGAGPQGPRPRALHETMRLEFGEVRIDDGFIRFLDRTTTPAFSQDLSRLALSLKGFGNQPNRRATLALQSVVGGDGGLDIRGEIGPLGGPVFIDLVGELRSFKLPSVDPYAVTTTGWVIKKGELQYTVRFKLDGDQLTAHNDVVVGELQVVPGRETDEVKRRIGLPLGLIVALIKDQKGDIRASVPVTGSVNDPKFGLGDAIWTAVKNVLTNIVAAPFKAIGSLFSGGETLEEPRVDAVTFAAGSSVLSPAMEEHLLRVADFLRRAPFVDLTMTSVPSRADVEALKSEAVTARLRDFQKERDLDDDAAALAAYYQEHLPDVPLPATVKEQLALLREREPAPDALLAGLARRRLEATRERLLKGEGIPATRLLMEEAPPTVSEAAGQGRVEFGVAARG
jgi:hypothetical protein